MANQGTNEAGSSAMLSDNSMINNIGDFVSAVPDCDFRRMNSNHRQNPTAATFVGNLDQNLDPNIHAIQQMHALEPLGWRGGDRYFDGM